MWKKNWFLTHTHHGNEYMVETRRTNYKYLPNSKPTNYDKQRHVASVWPVTWRNSQFVKQSWYFANYFKLNWQRCNSDCDAHNVPRLSIVTTHRCWHKQMYISAQTTNGTTFNFYIDIEIISNTNIFTLFYGQRVWYEFHGPRILCTIWQTCHSPDFHYNAKRLWTLLVMFCDNHLPIAPNWYSVIQRVINIDL